MKQTKNAINTYAKEYKTLIDFDRYFISWRFRNLVEHYPNLGSVLEVGCADGLMTEKLLGVSTSLDVVEGAEHYVDVVKQRCGHDLKISFHCSFFEDYVSDKKYDVVILSSILHEVDDPIGMLRKAKTFLKKGGFVYVNVPNALSIHRRVGRILGQLKDEHSFNERDHQFLHQRVYDEKLMMSDIKAAGLQVTKSGGYFLKVFSNQQLENLNPELLEAFYVVSKEMPSEFCAEIYAFCTY